MGLSRKLRRQQIKDRHIRKLAEQGKLAQAYVDEAIPALTSDTTLHTTGRVLNLCAYVLHKKWGLGQQRLLRFLSDVTTFVGEMEIEGMTHKDVFQALYDECGINMDEAMASARADNMKKIKERRDELSRLKAARVMEGKTL